MKTEKHLDNFLSFILMLAGLLTACSTIPLLNVNYHLPQKNNIERDNDFLIRKG